MVMPERNRRTSMEEVWSRMPMVPCPRQGWGVERYTKLESDEEPSRVARGDPGLPGKSYPSSRVGPISRQLGTRGTYCAVHSS